MDPDEENPFGRPTTGVNPFTGRTNKPGTGFIDENEPMKPAPAMPRTLGEALSEGAESAGKTIVDTVKGIPSAVGRAASKPGEYGAAVGNIPVDVIKSMLGFVDYVPGWAAYGGLKLGEMGGLDTTDAQKYVDRTLIAPGQAALEDLQSKYGHWFGGPGDTALTLDKGWQNLLNTVATRPLTVGTDLVSTVAPYAGKLVPTVKVPAHAASARLSSLGIDTSRLTASQIDDLRQRGNTIGWDKDAMQREYRTLLFKEAGINPTESMLSGDKNAWKHEDRLRQGHQGPEAAAKMFDEDKIRNQQVIDYTDRTRANMTGSPTRMDPAAVGNTITERFNIADDAAKAEVKRRYETAFDPTQLQLWGVREFVPEADVRGLSHALDQRLQGNPNHPFVATAETAPTTFSAIHYLKEFSANGRLPNAIPGDILPPGGAAGISWQSADAVRKHLVGLQNAARGNPTDFLAMNRVIDAFDSQFGKSNPLLNEARKAHSERMGTFHPDLHRAGDDIVKATKILENDMNSGVAQFNKLFSGQFTRGESLGAIQHLKAIFANDPVAMQAIKEGALEKVFINQKDYQHSTPQQTATAVRQALNGPQAALYRELFTPDELAYLQRHHDVVKEVGAMTQPVNPPRSGDVAIVGSRNSAMRAAASTTLGGLLSAVGGGLGLLGKDAATSAGAGVTGAGLGAMAGVPAAWAYRRMIADPAGTRAAGRMSFPPAQVREPLISKAQHGALSGAGLYMNAEDDTNDSTPIPGGALRSVR